MEENKIEELKEETPNVNTTEEVKEEVQSTNAVVEPKEVVQSSEVVLEKQPKKKKKGSKVPIVIAIISILLIVIIIGVAVYFKYTRDNRKVISTGITTLTEKFEKMSTRNKDIELTNNFTIDGNMKFDIESKLLSEYATTNPNYKPYVNLINNLNDTKNTFSLKQNVNDKKSLFEMKSELDNDELLGAKFFITEDKEYYFIKGFVDKYVESGDSEYFDSLEENSNTYDDIKYLYDFVMKSLKNNLKDEYFVKTDAVITIDGKKVNTKKITLKLDEKNGNELIRNIIKDLKNDKKAKDILKSYGEDIEDAEVNDVFEEGQEITFSVYVDNIFYNIKKYEMYTDDAEEKVTITYLDAEVDVIEIYEDDELSSSIEITNESKDKYVFNFFDDDHKKLANIALTNGKEKTEMSFYIEIDSVLVKGKMSSTYSNIVKKESYDNNTMLNFTIEANEEEIADVEITIDMKAKNSSEIDEDVSNAVTEDQITTEQKEKLDTIMTNALIKLMM